jgi:hypothetical protein
MNLDEAMIQFRIASRELFNNFFRVSGSKSEAWLLAERFGSVEELLFEKLVTEPLSITNARYGQVNPSIQVKVRAGNRASILINREVNSGYWDYPLTEFTDDATLCFIGFFDFDPVTWRDNQYVEAQVKAWSSQEDVLGKHALIDARDTRYELFRME